MGPVAERLDDPDPRRRARAVQVLGKVGDPGAVPALVAALADDDPRVAGAAVVALGQVADPAGLPALLDRLGADDDAPVTDALTRFGEGAVDPLRRALRDPRAPVRRHAAEVLGSIGAAGAAPDLAERLTDADAGVRLAVVVALGRLSGETADGAIRRAAASDDPRVRAVASRLTARAGRSAAPGRAERSR